MFSPVAGKVHLWFPKHIAQGAGTGPLHVLLFPLESPSFMISLLPGPHPENYSPSKPPGTFSHLGCLCHLYISDVVCYWTLQMVLLVLACIALYLTDWSSLRAKCWSELTLQLYWVPSVGPGIPDAQKVFVEMDWRHSEKWNAKHMKGSMTGRAFGIPEHSQVLHWTIGCDLCVSNAGHSLVHTPLLVNWYKSSEFTSSCVGT